MGVKRLLFGAPVGLEPTHREVLDFESDLSG